MRIVYELEDMGNYKKASCIGDLLKYRGETIYKLREGLNKIKNDKGISSMLINAMRKSKTMTGMTIENLINNLETGSQLEIFTFKTNDVELYKFFDNKQDLTLEIYMDDLFFQSKALLSQSLQGFRIRKLPFDVLMKKEKERWVRWFEKNLNDYHPLCKCKKTVIEE